MLRDSRRRQQDRHIKIYLTSILENRMIDIWFDANHSNLASTGNKID